MKQRYSPYHNNDLRDNGDHFDDISNTETNNICAKPSNSIRATHFNNVDDDKGVGPSNIPSFQHEDECEDDILVNNKDNRFIPPMVGSRRIDPLTSLTPILPSNMVAPNFLSNSNSDDINVGKLFSEKNELILQLRKVAFRDMSNKHFLISRMS